MLVSAVAVIVHYNSEDTLQGTVDEISLQIPSENIFVVDNSATLIREKLPEYVHVVTPETNIGYARGVNLGVNAALTSRPEAQVVLVATHEVKFSTRAIEVLVSAATNSHDSIFAPKLFRENAGGRSLWSSGGTLTWPGRYPTHNKQDISVDTPALWVDGACYAMNVDVWRMIQQVPEDFFVYMEDVALGLRCQSLGITIRVLSQASAIQNPNGPSRFLAIKNRWILADRYMGILDKTLVKCWLGLQAHKDVIPLKAFKKQADEARAAVRAARLAGEIGDRP